MNEKLRENFKIVNVNNKEYLLCEYMYGVLDMNHQSPLSCVSEANNSFSIDYWKGCSFQCAYCHVQGIYEDLDKDYKMLKKPILRSEFSIENIIDELINHPYFEKNNSVISIATSSTEPFANKETTESTLRIMEYFIEKGFKNPFWIVTKAGIPDSVFDRLKKICYHGNKVMISICWANNPKNIEPFCGNRFRNIEKLKNTGVTVSWYLRPLVAEWSANKVQLTEMFKEISIKYGDYIDMIIPGGLRWTEGIEFGLKEIRGLPMPKLIKKHNKKTLSNSIEKNIVNLCKRYFPNKPLYFNSSCALSHMLNRNNIALLNIFDQSICQKSICQNKCKKKCGNCNINSSILKKAEDKLKKMDITIKFISINPNDKIKSVPSFENFTYSEKQQIRKTIASIINNEGVN